MNTRQVYEYDPLSYKFVPFITSFPAGLPVFSSFNTLPRNFFTLDGTFVRVTSRSPLPFHYFYTHDAIGILTKRSIHSATRRDCGTSK